AVPAYFSIDGGVTKLADFGINSDPGDFLNPPDSDLTPNDPFNEIVGNLSNLTALDITVMDVLGFTPVPIQGIDLFEGNVGFDGTNLPYQIHNSGTDTSGTSTAGLYLSTDTTITTADVLVGTFATPALTAGASDSESIAASFSGAQAPGLYYLGVIVD